jgi:bifunctional UDP-N-acetylglucosamine pyrophosphorylase/glucosamine-1-phosphate N-acetyltransferase
VVRKVKNPKPIVAVILAAGKGKRMKSDLPKVLHKLGGKPMVEYVVETAKNVGVEKIILVIGYKWELTQNTLKYLSDGNFGRVEFVVQKEQLGTGHAVLQTKDHLSNFDGDILVLCGDMPLLTSNTLKRLLEEHRTKKAVATVLTAILEDPSRYGRIIRNKDGMVEKIVEYKDAYANEIKIKEINTGAFCFDSKSLFSVLDEITADNKQREYYLTDALEFLRKQNLPIWAVIAPNPQEGLGINSQEELERMEEILLAGSSGQTTLLP